MRELEFDERLCPKCGSIARANFVDISVGRQQCGPFHCCDCSWTEQAVHLDIIEADPDEILF